MHEARHPAGLVKAPRGPVRWAGVLVHRLALVPEHNDHKHDEDRRVEQREDDAGDFGANSRALIGDNVGEVVLVGGIEVVIGRPRGQQVLVSCAGLAVALDREWTRFEDEGSDLLLAAVSDAVHLDLVVSRRHIMTPSSLLCF